MGLTTSIVRIIKIAGDTIGAGFILTDDGLIATCAHVVANAGVRPGETVKIVFHYTGEERQAVVEAEWWRKPEAEDVAILRLIGELPEPVKPLPLGTSAGAASHPFETMGFPPTNPTGGILGSGMILGQTKINEMLVLQLRSQEVTGGFSGAPVWDCITRRVVGMVTATADPDGRWRLAETAFITPTETLHQVCPDLQLADICPYRGLTAFTESDAKFFFGREILVSSLVTHLRQNPRFLAVVGPSGSGKSSLVQAGLVPALRQGRLPESSAWYIITFRPGSNPFVALPDAGPYFSLENELELTIQQFFDSHQDVKRLVLFIDQFEELFALCSEPVQDQFMSKLSTLLKSSLPITVILTLRADFYGYLLHHNSLIEWLKIGQVNVPPISATDLQAIIEEPAKQVGLRFEPGLVDIITAEASQIDQPYHYLSQC
ncbi:MAG: serine protease [Anaerolineales bacterium]|nr:serine protease [Anaerolineales bacterium]